MDAVDLESPLEYIDFGHTDHTKLHSPSVFFSCSVIPLPTKDPFSTGHVITEYTTNTVKPMLIHTMQHEDSSLHTWDGYSSRNIQKLLQLEEQWTLQICQKINSSCSRKNAIHGLLSSCALSCQQKSHLTSGDKIFGLPFSLPDVSDIALYSTLLGWSTPQRTYMEITHTM